VDLRLYRVDDLQPLPGLEIREIPVEPLSQRWITSALENLLTEATPGEHRWNVKDRVLRASAVTRILGTHSSRSDRYRSRARFAPHQSAPKLVAGFRRADREESGNRLGLATVRACLLGRRVRPNAASCRCYSESLTVHSDHGHSALVYQVNRLAIRCVPDEVTHTGAERRRDPMGGHAACFPFQSFESADRLGCKRSASCQFDL